MTKEVIKDMLYFKICILFQAISCPPPGIGTDTTLNATAHPYRYQEVVNYTCNDDAAMVTRGSLSLQCGANGEWSNEPPTCRKYHYRLQRSWGKVMFLHVSVILFTGGSSASVHAGIYIPPGADPLEQTPPPVADLPTGADTPSPRSRHSPLGAVHAGRYGQQAGGTHPTGMHTCC